MRNCFKSICILWKDMWLTQMISMSSLKRYLDIILTTLQLILFLANAKLLLMKKETDYKICYLLQKQR